MACSGPFLVRFVVSRPAVFTPWSVAVSDVGLTDAVRRRRGDDDGRTIAKRTALEWTSLGRRTDRRRVDGRLRVDGQTVMIRHTDRPSWEDRWTIFRRQTIQIGQTDYHKKTSHHELQTDHPKCKVFNRPSHNMTLFEIDWRWLVQQLTMRSVDNGQTIWLGRLQDKFCTVHLHWLSILLFAFVCKSTGVSK